MITPLQRRSHFRFMLCLWDYDNDNTNKTNIRFHTTHTLSCYSIKIQSTLISSSALPAQIPSFQFSGYLKLITSVCRFTAGHLVVILVWIINHELIISLLIRCNILLIPPVFVKFEKVDLHNHAECLTK